MGGAGSSAVQETLKTATDAELKEALAGLSADDRTKLLAAVESARNSKRKVYKLIYFDARGVAEVIRFMFAVAQVEYEDKRFPFSFGTPGDFSTIQRPEFDEAKAAGELDSSAGKVPCLEVDGVKVGQSKAIERMLAADFGQYGSTNVQSLQIDSIAEMVRDIKDDYNAAKRDKAKGEELDAAMKTWFDETLPGKMKLVEKMVPADSAGPFLVGEKVSLADLTLLQFVAVKEGCFFDNVEGAKASFQDCPKIKAAMETTAAIPEIDAWIAKRPQNPF